MSHMCNRLVTKPQNGMVHVALSVVALIVRRESTRAMTVLRVASRNAKTEPHTMAPDVYQKQFRNAPRDLSLMLMGCVLPAPFHNVHPTPNSKEETVFMVSPSVPLAKFLPTTAVKVSKRPNALKISLGKEANALASLRSIASLDIF